METTIVRRDTFSGLGCTKWLDEVRFWSSCNCWTSKEDVFPLTFGELSVPIKKYYSNIPKHGLGFRHRGS